MSDEGMLEVKQALARMNEEERREISFYLQKLRHESREWKREIGRAMREMDRGKKVPLKDLAKRLGHA
jgi:hypothetical protein